MRTEANHFSVICISSLRVRTLAFFFASLSIMLAVFSGAQASPSVSGLGNAPLMRSLTEAQYRATIADIFGPEVPIVGRFEPGLRADGLIAIGTSSAGISAFSIEQYNASARAIAAYVVSDEHRKKWVHCVPESSAFDDGCAEQFITLYGKQLFRRPLSEEESARFVSVAQSAHKTLGDFHTGLEFALAGLLVSPEFLLRIERANPQASEEGQFELDRWSKATRLSYFLGGSSPDKELLRAAAAGDLDTEEGLSRQVDRLIAAPGFERAIRAFFSDMLRFDMFDDLAKDPIIYPAFNADVAADAQEQTLRTIVDLLVTQDSDYRDLFTTRKTFLTRNLGPVYRLPVSKRHGWEAHEFSLSSERIGIQSNFSFLALHSHPGRSSPTLRGKAIREVFFCQHIPDPPADVDFTGINDTSNKARPTARHRLEAHRTQPVCAGCHFLMDPLGLALERFDGLASFRTHENEALIDISGALDTMGFNTAEGLGQALRDYPQTTNCLVQNMLGTALGHNPGAKGMAARKELIDSFKSSGYRIPELMRSIALNKIFYTVAASKPDTNTLSAQASTGGKP